MNTLSSILKFIANSISPLLTNQTANKVLASPASATGKPSFRALNAADVPSLAASKITSGTFATDRIPSLNASKITAGTFSADRIPTISVSKVSGAVPSSGMYKVITWQANIGTLQANSYISTSEYPITGVPSGYTAVGVVGTSASSWRAMTTSCYVSGGKLRAGFCNPTSTNITSSVTVYVSILCLKGTSA